MEGMNALGHPIPTERKTAAYNTAKEMGIDTTEDREALVSSMVSHSEQDRPYDAQDAGLKFLDITGAYRLMAVLLTTPAS